VSPAKWAILGLEGGTLARVLSGGDGAPPASILVAVGLVCFTAGSGAPSGPPEDARDPGRELRGKIGYNPA